MIVEVCCGTFLSTLLLTFINGYYWCSLLCVYSSVNVCWNQHTLMLMDIEFPPGGLIKASTTTTTTSWSVKTLEIFSLYICPLNKG